MLISLALDPSIFSRQQLESGQGRQNAEAILIGAQENGLIIGDAEDILRRRIEAAIRELPTPLNQRLLVRWPELLKKDRRRYVKSLESLGAAGASSSLAELARCVAERCGGDAVVISDLGMPVGEHGGTGPETVLLPLYLDSAVEERRRRYLQLGEYDLLSQAEQEQAFIRAVRYSRWLRFYDKQLGRGGDNLHRFRACIAFVVDLWCRCAYFKSDLKEADIYTTEAAPIRAADTEQQAAEKKQGNAFARECLGKELVDWLRRRYPVKVSLHVKRDPKNIFHARHLESQQCAIRLERGFDFLDAHGQSKRTFLNIEKREIEHLREIRGLQDWHPDG